MENKINKFMRLFKNKGKLIENESLKKYLYYRIGGISKVVFFPDSIENLVETYNYIIDNNINYKIIGNGSNLLISDNTFDGIIVLLKNIKKEIKFYDEYIKINCAYDCITLTKILSSKNYTNHEFLSCIPGTIGGAIFMNAGTNISDISSCIHKVEVLTKEGIKVLNKEECEFEYRNSIFKRKKNILILNGYFKFEKQYKNSKESLKKVKENLIFRKKKQPIKYPSCGSVFKNPDLKNNIYAGKLIEEVGLKGKRIGNAQISEKHANFIINLGNATYEDVYKLINLTRQKVYKEKKIKLELEVEIF